MHSSIRLHDRLFRKVVAAPISFFETNPIGVLLNRVSRDTGIVDEILPGRMFDSGNEKFSSRTSLTVTMRRLKLND